MSKLYSLALEIIDGGAGFKQTADDNGLDKGERKELRRIIRDRRAWL